MRKEAYIYYTVHHVPKCMSCHKATAVITGRAHCLSFWLHMYIWLYMYIYVYIYTYNIYNIYTKYTIYIYNLSSWFWNILSVIICAEEKKYNIARSFHLFADSKTFTKESVHQEKLLRIHEKTKHGMEQQL